PNPYVEIEGESINEIEEVVNILGYSMEDTTSKSIFELIEDLNKNKIDYE
ncbi:adenylate cyclase, partial [Candidatus Arthromitus sp. SFB-2]